jgi:hypothetical protein
MSGQFDKYLIDVCEPLKIALLKELSLVDDNVKFYKDMETYPKPKDIDTIKVNLIKYTIDYYLSFVDRLRNVWRTGEVSDCTHGVSSPIK